MSIHKQMLSENYKDIVDNVLLNITGKTYNIKYLTEEEYKEIEENNNIQNNQILDKNNGTIDIKSEVGKGTEVVIRIPTK